LWTTGAGLHNHGEDKLNEVTSLEIDEGLVRHQLTPSERCEFEKSWDAGEFIGLREHLSSPRKAFLQTKHREVE
jgi:hypothetical protein